jgi:hypothetical protein
VGDLAGEAGLVEHDDPAITKGEDVLRGEAGRGRILPRPTGPVWRTA